MKRFVSFWIWCAAGVCCWAGGLERGDCCVQGMDLDSLVWRVDSVGFDAGDVAGWFAVEEIADVTFERMRGRSWTKGCPVGRDDLRYLVVPHYDGHGYVRVGELVCNKAVAEDLLAVFRELFEMGYGIERMRLVDDYGGDDIASMGANNTSCFNFRRVAGSRRLSRHAYGMAVDVNPLMNPEVSGRGTRRVVRPTAGKAYLDRSGKFEYKVTQAVVDVFRRHGFRWGGNWRSKKDWQHFER